MKPAGAWVYNVCMEAARKLDWRLVAVAVLAIANLIVWSAAAGNRGNGKLTVSFLDVGQGDAILVEGPTGNTMLIDAGKTAAVLRALGKELPFFDRTIDVALATHPDMDHIGGFAPVFERYRVPVLLESGVESDTPVDDGLRAAAASQGTRIVEARRGMVVDLGGGARFSVLFPDRDMDGAETNDASIVGVLAYGDSEFLLTGDAPESVERHLVALDGRNLDVDVLKAGHHGSDTSTSPEFASVTSPDYAVISAGKGNPYGHPHKEVIDALGAVGAAVVGTYDEGTIVFESDGSAVTRR